MPDDNSLNRLLSVRALRIYEDCVIWDTVLNEAALQLEQSDIPALCKLFYDEAGETEMMYNPIHLIEAIPGIKAEYAENIAVCTPNMTDGTG